MSISLVDLKQEQLLKWVTQALERSQKGKIPDYIPLLQKADPNGFAAYILTVHRAYSTGNLELTFPLMSVVKPFLLLYLLADLGSDAVFRRVGGQPSNYPFNSLEQLQIDRGFPRNPMINSGAITLASLLSGKDAAEACENLRLWLNKLGNCHLFLDELMLESVLSLPNVRNQALVQELAAKGSLDNPQLALNIYNYICCLAGNIVDLARLGLLLVSPPTALKVEHCQIVQEIMTISGLYESSGGFALKVGFPTKSGVSGVVLSLVPEQGVIACYSPPLDAQGNSVGGLFLIEQIAKALSINRF
ncbi:glutaminase [Gloeothece verrucosa]|uniref:glutaminase n=1 Tax=Gloeothece verrucosa (strain PCC 7822) TaxID=497965 RepID=E0UDH2_GLOV7|nr:glutaminase [Gloeothece verrucosa]ADN14163.1 Glutaminase [Gloeothece verrucosa PCC 7822]